MEGTRNERPKTKTPSVVAAVRPSVRPNAENERKNERTTQEGEGGTNGYKLAWPARLPDAAAFAVSALEIDST